MSINEAQRLVRMMDRSMIKRNTCVARIKAIHSIAQRASEVHELGPQLLVAVEDLDALWTDFVTEDNAVLEFLCELDRSVEYSGELSVEVRGLIIYSKSIAKQYNSSTGLEYEDKGSVTSGSRKSTSVERVNDVKRHVASSDAVVMPGVPVSGVRLPEVPLPSFSGDVHKWPAFRDRFHVMVDQRPQLSTIEKMYYLIGCLRNDAAELVRNIPVSADTYGLMWSTLEARYDKPRMVASTLIEKLLSAPLAPQETIATLNQFMSIFDEGISLLNSLHMPDLGDFLLFTLASRCLPVSCRTLFESSCNSEYPSVATLFTFIRARIAVLERVNHVPMPSQTDNSRNKAEGSRRFRKTVATSLITSNASTPKCLCCNGAHVLVDCGTFKGWSVEVRIKWVRERRLCFLCLSDKHWSQRCSSRNKCIHCSRKHHVLIHQNSMSSEQQDSKPHEVEQDKGFAAASLCGRYEKQGVLLGTALVHIRDSSGVLHTVRALIDSASEICAISSACVTRLGLQRIRCTAPVTGLSGVPVVNGEGLVDCQIQPRYTDDPVFQFKAWVFPSITTNLPRQSLSPCIASKFENIALADPSFAKSAPIDLLLGADIVSSSLNGKRITVGDAYPVALGSVFGWVLLGPIPSSGTPERYSGPVVLTTSVEALMNRFWQIEEPEGAPEDVTENGKCEAIYRNGYSRVENGRFSVPLPFRECITPDVFQGSRSMAVRRFENLERKLSKDSRLRDSYVQFMSEYIALGHMSPAMSRGLYVIPHHAVYKPSDVNPKIRVVFDASATSSTGISLNQCLLTGPKLQRDVIDILLLFRVPRFAFTADVCKMYRQILVAPEFRIYQHILWRESPMAELKEYELNTVTYGMNCAPFLAMRVIQSIAELECDDFPAVREVLLHHTYVDDVCVGADTEKDALQLKSELVFVLSKAGFELKKWASNSVAVLNEVPPSDRVDISSSFGDDDSIGVKVLGLQWNHQEDFFYYSVQSSEIVMTKRGMLSLIARIFDPLGLLAPIIFYAKHLMQRVWLSKLSWDEQLTPDLANDWQQFVFDLSAVTKLKIPRFLGTKTSGYGVLCGFCDASVKGYAAVVYIRLETANDRPCITLLGAKTKLSPLKATTIPRLELCAALLLAKWLARLRDTLNSKLIITDTVAWSDSSIVLNWLSAPHESFKVFVSNRIHQINVLLPGCKWNHIRTEDNPADCASRGLNPRELLHNSLYWKGPACLYKSMSEWGDAISLIPENQLPERKVVTPVALIGHEAPEWFTRFSSYNRMIRIVAWMQRFIAHCRGNQANSDGFYLSRKNLDEASLAIVRSTQRVSFNQLYRELANNLPVSSRVFARLRPFLNDQDVICVGGRLRNSDLPLEQKFPMLLPKTSHLSLMLVRHWHKVTCHGGPRVIMNIISCTFWILSLRTLIRTVISRCVRCVKVSATNPQPVMADLPRARISECRPFSRCGIDFAGPFRMKEQRLRKAREYKCYIAVFVCFVVKAVHIEVVSDLSTPAFLAALDRFVARRGLPVDIYSDCGTNFVGANAQLRRLLNDPNVRDQLITSVHCRWHFNPPSAPHFGGLWEAAVRSAKNLLKRVMGEHLFTWEEFTTLVYRVESILNSRPLTPASTDPSDLECITPGHFLIGQPLLTVPDVGDEDIPIRNLVNRWKLLQQCLQCFWKQWRSEYLQTLQPRGRWVSDQPQIKLNDMVVIKDKNSPVLSWRLGRVVEVLPGADGVIRVVRLHTLQGTITRPVVKLVILPTDG